MTLNEYQEKAMSTCMPSSNNIPYMLMNLVGEVGEYSSKMAKHLRKGEVYFHGGEIFPVEAEKYNPYDDEDMELEIGDILWQIAGLAHTMGYSLEEIAQQNLDKLAARKTRGTIIGNGDHR